LPSILAGELIQKPQKTDWTFQAYIQLGERADQIEKLEDGSFRVTGHGGTVIEAKWLPLPEV
jgi:thioredoxin reductase (NADPH)